MENTDELVAPEENLESASEVPNEPAEVLQKLHEFVIEKIQASDKLNGGDKAKAIEELNRLVAEGQVNNILLKNASTEFGSELCALFDWSKSDAPFWFKVDSAVWKNENIYPVTE